MLAATGLRDPRFGVENLFGSAGDDLANLALNHRPIFFLPLEEVGEALYRQGGVTVCLFVCLGCGYGSVTVIASSVRLYM